MQINWKLVSAALAVVVIYDETAGHINLKRFNKLKKRNARNKERVDYLSKKLDDAGVPVDDFDVIAMNAIKDM